MTKRVFVESSYFRKTVDGFGDSELLRRIQNEILKNPAYRDIIEGTNGLRKLRVAGKGKGKSGGYRVIYLDLPNKQKTYLLDIYSKGDQENITPEDKTYLKKLVTTLKGE